MPKNILHIGGLDKFTLPFIELVNQEFSLQNHFFLFLKKTNLTANSKNLRIASASIAGRLGYYCEAIIRMQFAKKIILHGLFDKWMVLVLFFMPWLLWRCYWVIYGGDLYVFKRRNENIRMKFMHYLRRGVIKRLGHLVTYLPGEVELARSWYGAQGNYQECFMYLSNVSDLNIFKNQNEKDLKANINLLVGNSADPSNCHLEILEKLLPFKEEQIKIFVPLSYGNKEYARNVIDTGRDWFGDKFVSLTSFMAFGEYLKFLNRIDIAIFSHKRQQAMGNTITLLAMGKTVFMRSDVSQWDYLVGIGVSLKDVEYFDLETLDPREAESNVRKVRSRFTKGVLRSQLAKIFKE